MDYLDTALKIAELLDAFYGTFYQSLGVQRRAAVIMEVWAVASEGDVDVRKAIEIFDARIGGVLKLKKHVDAYVAWDTWFERSMMR